MSCSQAPSQPRFRWLPLWTAQIASLLCSFPGDLKDTLNSYSTQPPVQTPWPSCIPGSQIYGTCQHLRSPPFPPLHNCPPGLSGPDLSTSTLTLPLRLSLRPSSGKAPRSILAPFAAHSCRLPPQAASPPPPPKSYQQHVLRGPPDPPAPL